MNVMGKATWIWWSMMLILLNPLSTIEGEVEKMGKHQRSHSTITFELKTGLTGYTKFLTRLRNQLEAPTRACGLRSTRSTPLPGQEYILVDLKISNQKWVTLGIDTKDAYVWAYQDNIKYNGRFRANFLKDAPQVAKNSLFPESTQRIITRIGGNYKSLEREAVKRTELVLGIRNLHTAIKSVHGKQESELDRGTTEANFFLMAIQMVSEATRFRFIQQGIVEGNNTVEFRYKMVALQNDWDKISQAIHKAEASTPKCKTFSPTLVVGDTDYRWKMTRVDEIKGYIGILKYKDPTSNVKSSIADASP